MATIQKRGRHYRAQVKVKGKRVTKTLPSLKEARMWAAEKEIELSRSRGQPINKTFGELIQRYAKEVSPTKRGKHWEEVRIERLIKTDPLAKVNLQQISQSDIAAWRNRRLAEVTGSTVVRDWNLLRHAIRIAIKEWNWLIDNPMDGVAIPKENKPRSRRPTEDELERLTLAFGYEMGQAPVRLSQRVGAAMWFAIETAMRAGEIAGLRRSDITGNTARLRNTKNGSDRDVPLSRVARQIIEPLEEGLFGVSSSQISSLFRKAKERAGVDGLTFHDMRREATSRMAKKLDLLTLAKITGHRDLQLLKDVYYSPDMDDIADQL